jgi:type I restriction enzyme, S subunit
MLTTAFAWLALGEAAKSLIGFGDIIESFNMGTWRALSLPLPPLESQRQITVFAELETARIDPLVTKVREAIERLRELRTALISAAVTGKIDVSNAA